MKTLIITGIISISIMSLAVNNTSDIDTLENDNTYLENPDTTKKKEKSSLKERLKKTKKGLQKATTAGSTGTNEGGQAGLTVTEEGVEEKKKEKK